jgi:hypothetical protein
MWTKPWILIASTVVILSAVGVISWWALRGDSGPALAGESVYVCTECEHTWDLSRDEFLKLAETQRNRRKNVDAPQRGHTVICEKCEKGTLVAAWKCPKDGNAVRGTGKDGQPGKCSKCGWTVPRP